MENFKGVSKQKRKKNIKRFEFHNNSIQDWVFTITSCRKVLVFEKMPDNKIQNSPYSVFRNYLLKEIRPEPCPLHNIHNLSGITY